MMANTMTKSRVRLGSERLLASGALKNKRVGVVSNPASIDVNFGTSFARLRLSPA